MRSVKDILADVQQLLDRQVNPALEMHGGKADALDFNDQTGEIRLLMSGGCSGCAGATYTCLLYTSPSPRDATLSRMPSSA